jgi:hypothetical protein
MRISRSAVVLFVVTVSLNAYAWGPRGHAITALVAERHLTPAAAAQVDDLLDGQSLADVASFADDVRNSRPESAPWHFADIPISVDTFSAARDCPAQPSEVGHACVIAAIDHYRAVLADATQPRATRAEALKFVVHFVGDLHQPLHSADNNDRGGNQVQVRFLGASTNLHKLWDSGLINRAKIPDNNDYADHVEELFEEAEIPQITAGTPIDWANEAHRLAITNAYRIPPSKTLGTAYVRRNLPVVDDQLMRGGLRLARVLNETLR